MEISEEGLEPVSPTGHYFNNSVLSISVLAVLEYEIPIDDSQFLSLLENVFLPINPRFSSIMIEKKGKKQWKRVEVKLEDHVKTPIFPSNLSNESYDEYFDDYLSNLATKRFPQDKPLWEFHVIKYPNSNAAGNVVFKLHHALGDGYSLMGALLSCLQRADNPSLPLTFPSRQPSKPKNENVMTRTFSSLLNTMSDIWWGISKSITGEDDRSPIKSSNIGFEFAPITVSTVTISLDHIKLIKSRLGVTINDVLTGMVFLGTRLYMQEMNQSSREAHSTALILLNTRVMGNYTSVEEMVKPDSKSPWGNHITFLQIPIPNLTEFSNTLDFVWKAQKTIKTKRNSLAIYFTSGLLQMLNRFGGHEAASRFIHRTLTNSSMAFTNLIGPVEQMSLANQPIKGLYFMIVGSPLDLDISVLSYMGKVRLTLTMKKGIIDPQKLKLCMENAHDMILNASDKYLVQNSTEK
ncbi:wax ester synthase/diacylglycerol acyltransferase 4-like [Pyrus x bretschneideri]|uniref:wax ester synthase/diacylglycerol acyltransferase 4-like n=1 Tax=Pyrus x bretschneideri TaxID=225117 RepID=UPI00202EF9DD|nr:wax ester synthase/diacylglycerol acyltransferase 4-like [Pyrus x bretschneideri]